MSILWPKQNEHLSQSIDTALGDSVHVTNMWWRMTIQIEEPLINVICPKFIRIWIATQTSTSCVTKVYLSLNHTVLMTRPHPGLCFDVSTQRITIEEFWSPHVSFSVTKHSHYDRVYTCEHGILIGNWLTKNTLDLTNKDWKQLVDKISVSIMDHSELPGGPQLSTQKTHTRS